MCVCLYVRLPLSSLPSHSVSLAGNARIGEPIGHLRHLLRVFGSAPRPHTNAGAPATPLAPFRRLKGSTRSGHPGTYVPSTSFRALKVSLDYDSTRGQQQGDTDGALDGSGAEVGLADTQLIESQEELDAQARRRAAKWRRFTTRVYNRTYAAPPEPRPSSSPAGARFQRSYTASHVELGTSGRRAALARRGSSLTPMRDTLQGQSGMSSQPVTEGGGGGLALSPPPFLTTPPSQGSLQRSMTWSEAFFGSEQASNATALRDLLRGSPTSKRILTANSSPLAKRKSGGAASSPAQPDAAGGAGDCESAASCSGVGEQLVGADLEASNSHSNIHAGATHAASGATRPSSPHAPPPPHPLLSLSLLLTPFDNVMSSIAGVGGGGRGEVHPESEGAAPSQGARHVADRQRQRRRARARDDDASSAATATATQRPGGEQGAGQQAHKELEDPAISQRLATVSNGKWQQRSSDIMAPHWGLPSPVPTAATSSNGDSVTGWTVTGWTPRSTNSTSITTSTVMDPPSRPRHNRLGIVRRDGVQPVSGEDSMDGDVAEVLALLSGV